MFYLTKSNSIPDSTKIMTPHVSLVSGSAVCYDSGEIQGSHLVEYLQSSGTQYIETGIIPDASTGIEIIVTSINGTDSYIVGARTDSGNTRWSIGQQSNQFYYGYVVASGTTSMGGLNITTTVSLNYLNNKKFIIINQNTVVKSISLPTLSFTPTYNIRLFGSAGISSSYTKFTGKLHAVKITQGQELVMDFIPVRIGTTGYMYDKISRKLFGNSGTGSFTVGPDLSIK